MKELVNSYVDWLRTEFVLRELGNGWHELVTPFLNHKNDMIALYLRDEKGQITISDGGNTINELALSGVEIDRSKRKMEEVNNILRSYGISKSVSNELIINTDKKKFPETKHRLLQAILSIDDMFMLSSPKLESFFIEDITTFFELNNLIFIKDTYFIGKTGFNHKFDFTLPKIKQRKEIAIKAVSMPRRDRISSVMWMIEDVKSVRQETEGFVVINDMHDVPNDIHIALKEYDIPYFTWSDRFNSIHKLQFSA